MGSTFQDQAAAVRLDRKLVAEERLREAQLGASAALVAHFTTSEEPAQLVLPTGVGKSLVLTLAPYILESSRALVVAPARLVRDQLARGFKTLEQVKRAGLLPEDSPAPTVEIARRRAQPEDWERWSSADVVVGTVNVLSDGYPDVTRVPRDMFDIVLFDEAHHLPASTWSRLLQAVDTRAILFTATPFRRDKERLPGKLAFVYPLQRAIDAGVYAPVSYVPVEPGAGEDKHVALAEAAKNRLLSTEHRDADSRLLVRSDRKNDAETLVETYGRLGVPLGLVTGDSSARAVRKTLEKVESGELLGFACVGALIEGFDFPTLKVAAYHAPHRSLEATLQFLGRLSRVTTIPGELVADPRDLSPDTARLYREDVAWEKLLPQIVDSAVDREQATREFLEEASDEGGELEIPWLGVAPPRSVQIYRLSQEPSLAFDGGRLGGHRVIQILHQPSSHLLAIVTDELYRPRFARTKHLDGHNFTLHLATWVSQPGLLFVSTGSPAALRELLEVCGLTSSDLIGADDLRHLLASTNASRFFSIGLRESRPRRASQASYSTLAGRRADGALGPDDSSNKLLGHAMGRAATGSGTFGISTGKGKYWEPANAESLFAFREWCEECASNIGGPGGTIPEGIRSIRIADRITAFPDHPIAAVLNEALLDGERLLVAGNQREEPLDVDLSVRKIDDSQIELSLESEGGLLGTINQHVDGSFEGSHTPNVVDRNTGELTSLASSLEASPPTIYFGDGTVVRGTSGGTADLESDGDVPSFVVGSSWTGIDTRVEEGTAAAGLVNIQDAVQHRCGTSSEWVIIDHGTGELADFVTITRDGAQIRVQVIHCKGSSQPPGGRVEDLYEVVGQTFRSLRWCRPGPTFWIEINRRLHERSATRIVHGDESSLLQLLGTWSSGSAPQTHFEVVVAQPALVAERTGHERPVRTLLLNAQSHCFQHDVDLQVWCNDGSGS